MDAILPCTDIEESREDEEYRAPETDEAPCSIGQTYTESSEDEEYSVGEHLELCQQKRKYPSRRP
jgi:hypothetical protein